MAIQQNDASGGAGSIAQQLLGVAVNGLSRAIDGHLSKKYPLTSFNETLTYDSTGTLRPSAAPQKDVPATETAKTYLSNPVVVAVGVSVGISVVLFVLLRAVK